MAAFEDTENAHLAAAQAAIEKLLTLKGGRTVENTLTLYDEAVRQIDFLARVPLRVQQRVCTRMNWNLLCHE